MDSIRSMTHWHSHARSLESCWDVVARIINTDTVDNATLRPTRSWVL